MALREILRVRPSQSPGGSAQGTRTRQLDSVCGGNGQLHPTHDNTVVMNRTPGGLRVGEARVGVAGVALGVGGGVAGEAGVMDERTCRAHVPQPSTLSTDVGGTDVVGAGAVIDPLAAAIEGNRAGNLGVGVVGDEGDDFLIGDVRLKPVAIDLDEVVHVLTADSAAGAVAACCGASSGRRDAVGLPWNALDS